MILESCEPVHSAMVQVNVDKVSFTAYPRSRIKVFVSVFNPDTGAVVKDLNKSHFKIKEEGHPFSSPSGVDLFVTTDRKLAYIIVLDTREKLTTSMTLVCQGLKTFIREMGFRYLGAVLTYTGTPAVLVRPTRDASLLAQEIDTLSPIKGPPRLYDGLLLAVNELNYLEKSKSKIGADRLSLILFTDGLNQHSKFSFAASEAKILQHSISLFVIGYGRKENPTLKKLAQFAPKTGGGFYFAESPDMISSLLSTIVDRLKYQYILTWQTKNIPPDGQKHEICVRVEKADIHGYGSLAFIAPKLEREKTVYVTAAILLGMVLLLLLASLFKRRFKAGPLKPLS